MEIGNWLKYWKKCLSDSLNSNIRVKNYERFYCKGFDINQDSIPNLKQVNRLIDIEEIRRNKNQGITIKDSEDWIKIDSVELLVSPMVLLPITDHQVLSGNVWESRPFWYFVTVNREGKLSVPSELFPILQRRYLEPIADERVKYVFGSMETVDNATSLATDGVNTYLAYVDYLGKVFKYITSQDMLSYTSEGYNMDNSAVILLPDEEIGAARAIIELYHRILNELKQNRRSIFPLLSNLVNLNNEVSEPPVEVSEFIEKDASYLGQMGADFPLSFSQRKAMYTLYEKKQPIFAINGPPGTGKTFMLQNIVANEMVLSAIEGGNPRIILACSNNNQAVTNIIDSFSKSNTSGEFKGRWLPDIEGYGTYLPRISMSEKELEGINYKKLNGDGLFNRVESMGYHDVAAPYYLDMAAEYLDIDPDYATFERVIEKLRDQIIIIKTTIEVLPEKWKHYKDAESSFLNAYCDPESTYKYYAGQELSINQFESDIQVLEKLEKGVIQYFDEEPFIRKLFCFFGFKFAHSSRLAHLQILFRDGIVSLPGNEVKLYRGSTLKIISDKIAVAKNIIKGLRVWKDWKEINKLNGVMPKTEKEFWKLEYEKAEKGKVNASVFDKIDVALRHKAFQLALHYWEGRWLIEMEDFEKGNKGRADSMRRWLRHAMLTPCFVSTFYMAPKFFTFAKHAGKNDRGRNIWKDGSLFNFIDILIVDEAGQVAPEVGVANFSLAKRAVIVGDVMQIEPIWNISKPVDLGNLKKCALIDDYEDEETYESYENKGFLSSSGSIMKMAQNACNYKEERIAEKGVMLLEHRRCYNEIIDYCNNLAYNGLLKPLKGRTPKDNLFRPMILIDVQGSSVRKNNSRGNHKEVDAIAQWLVFNKKNIENTYGSIEENVGIITPFVHQKYLLKNKLKAQGLNTDLLKLGTVHALQGAERPIVLFSMVYGSGEVGSMFFDYGPNMLNVAVSRAKDTFIVFANSKILNNKSNTPSGKLTNYLEVQENLVS